MDKIYSLFLVRCIISVVSLNFLMTRLSLERKYMIIPDFTARSRKNSSCVMVMTISDSERFLMDISSIWRVVLIDRTNTLCAWELIMRFQVWIGRL